MTWRFWKKKTTVDPYDYCKSIGAEVAQTAIDLSEKAELRDYIS